MPRDTLKVLPQDEEEMRNWVLPEHTRRLETRFGQLFTISVGLVEKLARSKSRYIDSVWQRADEAAGKVKCLEDMVRRFEVIVFEMATNKKMVDTALTNSLEHAEYLQGKVNELKGKLDKKGFDVINLKAIVQTKKGELEELRTLVATQAEQLSVVQSKDLIIEEYKSSKWRWSTLLFRLWR